MNYRFRVLLHFLLVPACIAGGTFAAARYVAAQTRSDVTIPHPVTAVFNTGIAAFNARDLDMLMQQWDDDIRMYTADAGWLHGRDAVRARFVATFRQFPDVVMEIEDLRVRAVTAEVATVDFAFIVYPQGTGPAFRGVGSGVYVQREGRWVEVLEHESAVSFDAPR